MGPDGHRGELSGSYVRETTSPAHLALGFVLIPLVLSLCVVPIGFGELGGPMWIALIIVAVALAGIVLIFREWRNPGRHWWVYVFRDGLETVDFRGEVRDRVRWTEIDQVDWQWAPHDDRGGAHLTGYRLHTFDGRTITFGTGYRNANDPNAPGPGDPRSLAVRPAPARPPFPTLAEVLDEAVVRPLTRRALAGLDGGQTLVFGKGTASRDGLTYGRKHAVGWAEIAAWRVAEGELKLDRPAARPRRITLPVYAMPGGWILVRILAERAPRTGRVIP